MTKDRDFLHLLFEQGPPPQVIWLWPTFVRVSPGWKLARPSETGCIRCLGSSHREGVLWHHEARGSRVLFFVPEQRKQDGRAGGPHRACSLFLATGSPAGLTSFSWPSDPQAKRRPIRAMDHDEE